MSIRKGTTIIAGNSSPLDWTGTLQEYNMALENGIIKQNMVCYITDDTLYTDDIRPEIETLNSVKANKDLSNLSEVGEKHFLNKSQITNCLLEVPQNIKLELKDGVLTLKAGSEVIIPNGFEEDGATPRFDYVTIESDYSHGTSTVHTSGMLLPILSENKCVGLEVFPFNLINSGSTDTGSATHIWYDISTNLIKMYDNGTLTRTDGLPVSTFIGNGSQITSIDQVFNGMGYIGSTVWVDKEVKGLIPNGRNEDGSLKNIELVTNIIMLETYDSTVNTDTYHYLVAEADVGSGLFNNTIFWSLPTEYIKSSVQPPTNQYTLWYDIENNLHKRCMNSEWHIVKVAKIGNEVVTNGVITSFNPKQPFRAVDYQEASGLGMPSNRFEQFTLGASMSSYTAPANGWFQAVLTTGNGSGILNFINTSVGNTGPMIVVPAYNSSKLITPVKRGDVIKLEYTSMNTSGFNQLVFIYAEGEQ